MTAGLRPQRHVGAENTQMDNAIARKTRQHDALQPPSTIPPQPFQQTVSKAPAPHRRASTAIRGMPARWLARRGRYPDPRVVGTALRHLSGLLEQATWLGFSRLATVGDARPRPTTSILKNHVLTRHAI